MKTVDLNPSNHVKPLSLRTNFSWIFVGNVIYAGSQWGVLVALAKLGSTEMVGTYALGLAITAPIFMLGNLQLRAIQATDAQADFGFRDYLGLRLLTSICALLLIGAIAASTYSSESRLVIMFVGLAKGFESLSDLVYGLLQKLERMDRIGMSLIIKGPASLAAFTVGLLISGRVLGGVIGILIVWALLFFAFDLTSARLLQPSSSTLKPRWDWHALFRLAWLALPLGIVMMLLSLSTSIPRLFVERFLGESQLGIFAALAYLLVAGSTVVTALGQSASARLAKYYMGGDLRSYVRLLSRLMIIAGILGLGGSVASIVAGSNILYVLYGPEYATQTNVFIYVMLAAGITYLNALAGYGLTAARHIKLQPVILLVSVTCSVLVGAVIIPMHGLVGAAWTLILTNAVQAILTFTYLSVAIHRLRRHRLVS